MNQPNRQIDRTNGFAVARDLNPRLAATGLLTPLGGRTRNHPHTHIRKLQASIELHGFVMPILIDGANRVIAGWGLVMAARKIGLPEVPAVIISDLDEAHLRLLRLALNRLGEDSGWDVGALRIEFSEVLELSSNIDLRVSGFEMGEIDMALSASSADEEDAMPPPNAAASVTTKRGDLWLLGEHRALRRRPGPGELSAPHGRGARPNGVHRPTVEYRNRWQCLGARDDQT